MNLIALGIIVSFVFAGVTFIASQNIFSSLIILAVYTAFFVLIARRQINKNEQKIHRYHQCFQFINSYLISLNVKGSLNAAMESSYETADEGTKEIIDSIKELSEQEKLSYLTKYFKFDLYHLFVDTVSLWSEQGGDILKMSHHLVDQVRLKEEYLLTCESLNKSKTVEFVVLWAIALVILAALRFALSQFFDRISKTIVYQVAVIVVILFALFSIYILILRITNVNLEGWKDEEK
jgi:hypothetical protein